MRLMPPEVACAECAVMRQEEEKGNHRSKPHVIPRLQTASNVSHGPGLCTASLGPIV